MCLSKSTVRPHQRSQKTNVNQVQEETASSSDESNDEYLYTMNYDSNVPKIPKVSVKIDDVVAEMIVDTGATTDILDEATYCNIRQ